jgi:ornithine decarboxylase
MLGHAETHVPLASWPRNDVRRSRGLTAIGPFDRSVNQGPHAAAPLNYKGTASMIPFAERFASDRSFPTPCVAVDLDTVSSRHADFRQALPFADVFYAVKANPARPVLQRLVELGASFDAASIEEIRACLEAGAPPGRISFGNTVKKESSIAEACAHGIDLFAFDSAGELDKLVRLAPGARVYCRLLVGNDGAEWPLSRKFGCETDMAVELMALAARSGMVPYGLSFHVGSQQTHPAAWEPAIARAADVANQLHGRGVDIHALNIGGGYPARYRDPVPAIAIYGKAIASSLHRHFPRGLPAVMAEPGRSLVAEAGVLVSEVVLVSRKSEAEETRWVYIDIGRFGGLAETEGEAIRYEMRTVHDGGPDGPVIIAGPTCDSVDTLYQRSGYRMPLALAPGDRVILLCAGAYVTSYASQGFNGFPPPTEIYVDSNAGKATP